MIDYLDLKRMANHLEPLAGQTTRANDNEYGQLLRVLFATQRLAGVPTARPDHPTWVSYLEAIAAASEALAGFEPQIGPDHDPSYWYRIFKSYALFSNIVFTRFLQEAARDAILNYNPATVLADSLLAENGDFILSEDADRVLVE